MTAFFSTPNDEKVAADNRYFHQNQLLKSTVKFSNLLPSSYSTDEVNNNQKPVYLSSKKILMVGAGGIGCELLKNLVLTGFLNIQVVDLDTIDLSNLNRQFLFQKQHIKQSKAEVARLSALEFNPDACIIAHHASIFDAKFDLDWYKSFDIVLNALDNLAARRHVNMMCQASEVPLIESGTAGYLGQVTFHKRALTHCFDCEPKPTPKTFPVCTIRSTPSAPIHCIVWAKNFLFNQLLGDDEEEEQSIDNSENQENKEEIEALKKESSILKEIRTSLTMDGVEDRVFQKVFHDDIVRLLSMTGLWKDKRPPTPLDLSSIKKTRVEKLIGLQREQTIWTLANNYKVFCDSLRSLVNRLLEMRKTDPKACLTFDKDDEDALDFVTASSNLRSTIYGIENQTRFKVKEIAGNIIPAIATTNAIIAGMIVIQAIKILCDLNESKKDTFVIYDSHKDRYFFNQNYESPNTQCVVCRCTYLQVCVDNKKHTLGQLLEKVIREDQHWKIFDDIVIEESGRILFDPDFDDQESSVLHDLKIQNGAIITMTLEDPEDSKRYYLVKFIIKNVENLDKIQVSGTKKLFALNRPTKQDEVDDNFQENKDFQKRCSDENLESENKKIKLDVIDLDDDDYGIVQLD